MYINFIAQDQVPQHKKFKLLFNWIDILGLLNFILSFRSIGFNCEPGQENLVRKTPRDVAVLRTTVVYWKFHIWHKLAHVYF